MPYFNNGKWCCDKCSSEHADRSGAIACEDRDKAQEKDLNGKG